MFINITKINIPKVLEDILITLKNSGAKPILIGGCVRDSFLNLDIKDYDIEVYNVEQIEDIERVLEKFATVKLVGKSFGVLTLKIDDLDFDFSLPRVEKKVGKTHQDFDIQTDAKMDFKKACRRRDFTINAIGYDFFSNSFLDPYNGLKDLKIKKIRHIYSKSFVEDSLRVYRAIGFASRFDFKITKSTKRLCKKIIKNRELDFLPKQRVFEELKKLLLKSKKPSIGLKLLEEFKIFELSFKKTYKSVDRLASFLREKNIEERRKLALFYALILKDAKEKKVSFFMESVFDDKKLINHINLLLKNQLNSSVKELKRVSQKLQIEDLLFLEFAKKSKDIKELKKIEKLAKSFDILNKPLKPLIYGKDLIDLGFTPSSNFKNILDFAFDLQIDKEFSKNEILNILKSKKESYN